MLSVSVVEHASRIWMAMACATMLTLASASSMNVGLAMGLERSMSADAKVCQQVNAIAGQSMGLQPKWDLRRQEVVYV